MEEFLDCVHEEIRFQVYSVIRDITDAISCHQKQTEVDIYHEKNCISNNLIDDLLRHITYLQDRCVSNADVMQSLRARAQWTRRAFIADVG